MKMKSFKLLKKSLLKAPLKAAAKGVGVGPDFILIDNQNDTATVAGIDSVGNPTTLDPNIVSITVSSSDMTILTVGTPTGLTFPFSTTGKLSVPGTPVVLTATATWSDGSVGPFTGTLPVDVVAGPTSGVIVIPATPTP